MPNIQHPNSNLFKANWLGYEGGTEEDQPGGSTVYLTITTRNKDIDFVNNNASVDKCKKSLNILDIKK